jgi:hypothetical protein
MIEWTVNEYPDLMIFAAETAPYRSREFQNEGIN